MSSRRRRDSQDDAFEHDALFQRANRRRNVYSLRRVFAIAVITCSTHLGLLAPAGATTGGCDASCKQQEIVWYWNAEQTLAREWYGAINAVQPWALCVKAHESASAGLYRAYDGSGNYGAYQDAQSTWDTAAAWAGRPDLVGADIVNVPGWDQENINAVLHAHEGASPWFGDGCG